MGGEMLVLTRFIQEEIVIGDDIRIKVLGVKSNQVLLGISAPKSIPIHREEIYLKIKEAALKTIDDTTIN